MTVLSYSNRKLVEDQFVQDLSTRRDPTSMLRSEIAENVAAIDNALEKFLNEDLPTALPASATKMTERQLDDLARMIGNKRREVKHG